MLTNHTDQNGFADNANYIDLRTSTQTDVDLPDIYWLTSADFDRQGPDLVITGPDGQEIVLVGYFNMSPLPSLTGSGDMTIPANVINVMAGQRAPQQTAQTGELQLGEPIGQIETAEGSVFAVRVDGTRVELKQGDPIYQGDTLETGEDGVVGITFADDSTLSLAENGRMVIDEMVYDPGAQDGSASLFVLQGAMSFVSGQLAKVNPDAMTIETPVATIGIRGTSALIETQPPTTPGGTGQTNVGILPENGPGGTPFVGEIAIITPGGTQILSGSFQYSQVTDPNTGPSPVAYVTLADVGRIFGNSILNNPNQNAMPDKLVDVTRKVVQQIQAERKEEEAQAKVDDARNRADNLRAQSEQAQSAEEKAALEQQAQQAEQEAQEAEQELQDAQAQQDQAEQEAKDAIVDYANEVGNDEIIGDNNNQNNQNDPQNQNTGNGNVPNPETPPTNNGRDITGDIVNIIKDVIGIGNKGNQEPIGNGNGEGNGDGEVDDPVIDEPELPKELTANPFTVNGNEDDQYITFSPSDIVAMVKNSSDPMTGDDLVSIDGVAVEPEVSWGEALSMSNGSLYFDGYSFTYTPNADWNGVESFSYTVEDGGKEVSSTVNIDVAPVYDAITNDEQAPPIELATIAEDETLTFTKEELLQNVSNPDGSPLTISNVNAMTGSVVDNGDGTWTYTPPSNYNGSIDIYFDVSDGTTDLTGLSAISSVTPVNDAPTLDNPVLGNAEYCVATDAPTTPFNLMTITDIDSPADQIASATITIGGFETGDTLNITNASQGVLDSYDPITGVMTLTGNDLISAYETLLRSITFENTGASMGSRTITVQITDEWGESISLSRSVDLVNTDPLVIDLNGDGVGLVDADNGVQFDTDNDGELEQTGWADSNDGLLTIDVNGDGIINDMSEVVSAHLDHPDLADSDMPQSSLEVLALFDDNDDGVIDSQDSIFDQLSIWQDANQNGITDEGELLGLAERGITSIQLDYDSTKEDVNGNTVLKGGTVTFEDGSQSDWNEVAFDTKSQDGYTTTDTPDDTPDVYAAE